MTGSKLEACRWQNTNKFLPEPIQLMGNFSDDVRYACAQMVQYGFDVNKGDYDNRTALMLAVVGGHAAAVNTLLGAGADANVQVCTETHKARDRGSEV